ncbi:MAG TPA: TetR/AcrR family transcriptional regulator [Paracoccaceae bacterium]|nr:TetR/AcrR family transcriptional regulator [Paracoccaceae bacterium]
MARTHGSHSGITGPRIRAAALHLIARHGFEAVTMRQIAAEVGVQAGALYRYTPDKQALLADLMQAHMDDLHAALSALPPLPDPVAALDRFARFHVGFHLDRPDAVFVAYMELRSLTPANFARIEAARRSYEDALEGILARGVAAGAFALSHPRMATRAIIAMLTGVTQWFRDDGPMSRAQVADLYAAMVLRLAAATPSARP